MKVLWQIVWAICLTMGLLAEGAKASTSFNYAEYLAKKADIIAGNINHFEVHFQPRYSNSDFLDPRLSKAIKKILTNLYLVSKNGQINPFLKELILSTSIRAEERPNFKGSFSDLITTQFYLIYLLPFDCLKKQFLKSFDMNSQEFSKIDPKINEHLLPIFTLFRDVFDSKQYSHPQEQELYSTIFDFYADPEHAYLLPLENLIYAFADLIMVKIKLETLWNLKALILPEPTSAETVEEMLIWFFKEFDDTRDTIMKTQFSFLMASPASGEDPNLEMLFSVLSREFNEIRKFLPYLK